MSVSNLYEPGNENYPFTNIYANSVNANTFTQAAGAFVVMDTPAAITLTTGASGVPLYFSNVVAGNGVAQGATGAYTVEQKGMYAVNLLTSASFGASSDAVLYSIGNNSPQHSMNMYVYGTNPVANFSGLVYLEAGGVLTLSVQQIAAGSTHDAITTGTDNNNQFNVALVQALA